MTLQAVAVVKIPRARLDEALEKKDDKWIGRHGLPFDVVSVGEGSALYTGAPMRDVEPDELAMLVRTMLGELLDEHTDERGIFIYPDSLKTSTDSYDALLEEVGEMGEWVPVVPPDYVPARLRNAPEGSLEAMAGSLLQDLGGTLGAFQSAMASGDSAALGQALAGVQQALAKSEQGQELMAAVAQMMAEGKGPDPEAILKNLPIDPSQLAGLMGGGPKDEDDG